MKRILLGAMVMASLSAVAQETYQNAELVENDLNGTARYVGMGGAMEALGADISTIGTNPAGIGMFRRSQVSMSAGLTSMQDCGASQYLDGTNPSFDQVGIVWSNRMGYNSFLNFGFNYHKSKNLNQILNAADVLNGASQQKLSYLKTATAGSENDLDISQLDLLYYNAFLLDKGGNLGYNDAAAYAMQSTTKGYIGEYDINISGNVSNQVYLGMTIGIHDVNYHSQSHYTEALVNAADQAIGSIVVNDERYIDGTGVDLKFGAIFFPIENSPLRFGLSVATPTWYDLRAENYTTLTNGAKIEFTPSNANYNCHEVYDYKVFTPWKFGLSAGHTIGNYLALGLSYEYADYANLKNRVLDGIYYGSDPSHNDVEMNTNTSYSLRAVNTVKFGVECKPTPEVSVRFGYNFVSPMYREEGYRDPFCWSHGNYYASRTDYTNWKATNRFTAGVGYAKNGFSFDLAYQYSGTNGTFRPFADTWGDIEWSDGVEEIDNYAQPVSVSNKRHQLIATIGYRF